MVFEADPYCVSNDCGYLPHLQTDDKPTDKLIKAMEEIRELCTKVECSQQELTLLSGGVQQYLNRQNKSSTTEDGSKGAGSVARRGGVTFSSLPVYVKLHIFSYLSAKDLCRLSVVSRNWLVLTGDNILWNELLERDMVTWDVISHMTNPSVYREVDSEWSNKEVYLQCCPKVRKLMRQENYTFMNISTMIRSFLPKKAPKVAMFGPGLESSTSGIVRKILYEQNRLFEIKRMFPGQFEGVGSGMTLQMQNGLIFDLSVLYSSTKKDRENQITNRMQRNRLVQHSVHQMEEGVTTPGYELTQAVRDLCRTLDAFIFVVDSSVSSSSENLNNAELFAMVTERWSATHVPVLVMSCVKDSSQPRVSCVEVAERLNLRELDKPWQVNNCAVDSLDGVAEGVQWLIEQSQRR